MQFKISFRLISLTNIAFQVPKSVKFNKSVVSAIIIENNTLNKSLRCQIRYIHIYMFLIGTLCGVGQRFAADFYVADAKSGRRALVKAGHHSKVVPLIDENLLVTTSRGTELSSTLEHWLEERNLSSEEAQIIRLEEG